MGDLSWALKNGDLDKVKESIDSQVSIAWMQTCFTILLSFLMIEVKVFLTLTLKHFDPI